MVKHNEKEKAIQDSLSSGLLDDEAPKPRSLSERMSVSAIGLLQSAVSQGPAGAAEVLSSTASSSAKGEPSADSTGSVVSSEAFGSRPTSTSSDLSWRSAANYHFDSHPISKPEVYDFATFVESSGIRSCENRSGTSQDSEGNGNPKHGEDRNQLLDHTVRPAPNHRRAAPNIDAVDMMPTGALEDQRAGLTIGYDEAPHSFDGAEVVRLLSDQTFCVDDVPLDVFHGAELSGQERKMSSQAPVPRRVNISDAITNPLHLIPGSGIDPVILEKMADTMPHVDDYAQDLDLQPWLQILNSYHDEVWGDMLPLVRQAREEIGQSDNKQKVQDRPATRRLRMLIGHLKH